MNLTSQNLRIPNYSNYQHFWYQTITDLKNKDDKNDIQTFNKFIKFINIFIPHLIINSNSETNVIKIDDTNNNVTIEQLHEVFKVASKGKRKAMYDNYVKENTK